MLSAVCDLCDGVCPPSSSERVSHTKIPTPGEARYGTKQPAASNASEVKPQKPNRKSQTPESKLATTQNLHPAIVSKTDGWDG
uniref:Uncharacterized protein n=1 Tax=Anopheles atroparvus TaxID=41427 RepID=A0AAG5DW91_ANOAO